MSTDTPSRGDVFHARLDPTEGSEQAGTRPVVIVSRNAINQHSSVVICVPISDRSNFSKVYPSQVELTKGMGGLALTSVAMCEQVRAINVSRLQKLRGHLGDRQMRQIDLALRIALNLS